VRISPIVSAPSNILTLREEQASKDLLSVGDVEQVAYSVVVGFERSPIRFRRGSQQCGGGFPLPERGVQVCIRSPALVFNSPP
jgi:hypothetical protein